MIDLFFQWEDQDTDSEKCLSFQSASLMFLQIAVLKLLGLIGVEQTYAIPIKPFIFCPSVQAMLYVCKSRV